MNKLTAGDGVNQEILSEGDEIGELLDRIRETFPLDKYLVSVNYGFEDNDHVFKFSAIFLGSELPLSYLSACICQGGEWSIKDA